MTRLRPLLGKAKRKAYEMGRRVRCSLSDHAVCLIYHRVVELEKDTQLLAVSPERFRRQMIHVKENHPVLSPAELHERITAGKVPRNGVVITFDDGYADNILHMLPIIEEVKVPVTVFVSTDLLGGDREFWWDELERIFLVPATLPRQLAFPWQGGSVTLPTDSADSIRTAYGRMHRMIKTLPPSERELRLAFLRRWAGIGDAGRPTHRSMTRAEVAALSRSPFVTIGAHTCSHTALVSLTPGEQESEIARSKSILEEMTGREIEFFSYPFGEKSDYTRESPAICRTLGFKGAYSNYYGHIFNRTDPFQIPRILVRDWDLDAFRGHLNRFFRS